jgi:hypothetical protein
LTDFPSRRILRAAATAFFLLSATAFSPVATDVAKPRIDRIEIRESGWSSRDIELNRDGRGRYRLSDYPRKRSGKFSVTPQQFERLRDKLEEFRGAAVPFTNESVREFIEGTCPEGVPYVTDVGAVYIRWIGPGTDEHYLAELGCDRDGHADRNRKLEEILKILPAPRDLWSRK